MPSFRTLIASLAFACGLPALPVAAHDKLGANLNFIGDFRRNHEFVDVVKQSRRFLKIGTFDDQQAANLAPIGADGWPTTDFRILGMAAQQNTTGLSGTYRIVFNGQAILSVGGGGGGTIANHGFNATTNTSTADLVFPAGAENLIVDFASTGGVVKNVRILRPGYDPATAPLLHTPWLDHAKRFPVIRFLDWTRTNGNRAVTWADRTTPEKLRTEAQIAQWETVIDAANALNRDPWINVPIQANDEYVTSLATLFRDRLNANLNVYVEYGNELWNFQIRDEDMDRINGNTAFNGATINRDLAAASIAGSPLRFGGESDANTLGFRRVALRLKEISDIFKTVWGASAINTRVRPILAGQMANSFIVTEGLRLVDEGLDIRPDTVFYGISGAPYIFASAVPNSEADEVPGMSVQQILDGINAGVANASAENAYQYLTHAGLGAWYGLKVVAYEAGFDNFGEVNIANKRLANLDPAIRESCKSLINTWHSFGFEHILWFNAGADTYNTRSGMWPLVEDMGNQATPKNQCMDDILASALPAVTVGTAVLGAPVAGGNFRGSSTPTSAVSGLASPFGFPGYVEYLLRADAAGTYGLVFNGSAPATESFRLKLNNATVASSVSLPVSAGNSSAITVTLRKGLNALRLERNGSGSSWSINNFSFTVIELAATLTASPSGVDFGGQSMRTTAPTQAVTLSNSGGGSVTVSSITASTHFAVAHNCATVASGNSCTATVSFTPTAEGSLNGTLTIVSNAGTQTVPVAGTGEKSLVTHYYRSILRRAPDAGGKAFWNAEAARVQALGVNVNEVWFALSGSFFASGEYLAFNRDNTGYATDLFNTFFNRAPDAAGLAFWKGELDQGMPREVVLASFMFSTEFANFTQAIFGATSTRKEVDTVVDFYRGLLGALPDDGGFNFWLGQFRTAQCQGGEAVNSRIETISSAFATSQEYANRGRGNAQYVGDLYNAFMRRGAPGDLAGVNFWIGQIASGAMSRETVRQAFVASGEFQSRVAAIIAQGCLP